MKNEKPIIGVVSRPILSMTNRNMLGVYETYQKAIIKANGIPLSILPTSSFSYDDSNLKSKTSIEERQDIYKILDLCDGIILPGGENGFMYDYDILDYCIKKDIPILGICLGMQIMAEYSSGKKMSPIYNHYLTNHKINIKKGSILYELFKDEIIVNSRHKCCVSEVGTYQVIALSENTIEAIIYPYNTFNLGVQWHPEDIKSQSILFDYFINICKMKK